MTIQRKLQSVVHGDFRQDAVDLKYAEESGAAMDIVLTRLDESNAMIKTLQDNLHAEEEKKKKVEGERDQAKDDAKKSHEDHAAMDERADERANVKGVALHLKAATMDAMKSMSSADIKKSVVTKQNPDLKMDGLDVGRIEGRYDAICDGIQAELKANGQTLKLGEITSPQIGKNDAAPAGERDYRADALKAPSIVGMTEAKAQEVLGAHADKMDERHQSA